jgi:hypothetical protein
MRKLSILFMLLFTVSIIPAYAQNVHIDEEERQILEEIKECEYKIMSDDSLTDASKTVEKRKCSSEIRKNYAETPLTSEQRDELKIRLQNLQKCEDWHSQYKFIDEANFKIQKNAQIVQSCITLYGDPIWTYSGEDRVEILSEKLEEILVQVPVKENLTDELPKELEYRVDRIASLEKRIADLESQLHGKDLIIREQMNVISNLANSLRNAVFDGIQSVYPFL